MLEDGITESNDIRYRTPERAPPVKIFHIGTPDSDADMEDNGAKVGRMDPGSAMTDMGVDQLHVMSEEDKKIIASVILGVDITEVYSPKRIARVAEQFGLTAGSSMDLTNGWDFFRSDHRRAAWKQIEKEDPYLLVGSPPCTLFGMLMELKIHINREYPAWMKKYEREKAKAIVHVNFCCSLYERQLK